MLLYLLILHYDKPQTATRSTQACVQTRDSHARHIIDPVTRKGRGQRTVFLANDDDARYLSGANRKGANLLCSSLGYYTRTAEPRRAWPKEASELLIPSQQNHRATRQEVTGQAPRPRVRRRRSLPCTTVPGTAIPHSCVSHGGTVL